MSHPWSVLEYGWIFNGDPFIPMGVHVFLGMSIHIHGCPWIIHPSIFVPIAQSGSTMLKFHARKFPRFPGSDVPTGNSIPHAVKSDGNSDGGITRDCDGDSNNQQ